MSTKFQLLLRRASDLLNIGYRRHSLSDDFDEEVVYSKNNVCVHSIDKQNNDLIHNLGYLTVRRCLINTDHLDDHKWTLCLQWTPNQCLTKHLEQSCDYNGLNDINVQIGRIDSEKTHIELKNNKNDTSDEMNDT